jgi:hypothetical protein
MLTYPEYAPLRRHPRLGRAVLATLGGESCCAPRGRLRGDLARGDLVRDRGARRGAALIEALVVIPFFILTLAALVFAGSVYSTKLKAMREAKSRAWAYAMSNCGEAGNGSIGDARNWNGATQSFDGNPTAGVSTSGANAAQGGQGTSSIHKDVNAAVVTVEYSTRSDAQIGAHEVRPKATERVVCNEPPYDANLSNIMRRAFSTLTGF